MHSRLPREGINVFRYGGEILPEQFTRPGEKPTERRFMLRRMIYRQDSLARGGYVSFYQGRQRIIFALKPDGKVEVLESQKLWGMDDASVHNYSHEDGQTPPLRAFIAARRIHSGVGTQADQRVLRSFASVPEPSVAVHSVYKGPRNSLIVITSNGRDIKVSGICV